MTEGTDWVDQARRLVTGLGRSLGETLHEGDAAGAPPGDCRWCPVCQLAAVVRGERPDVTDALADVLTAAAGALRTLSEATPDPSAEPAAQEQSPPPVQHIDIA